MPPAPEEPEAGTFNDSQLVSNGLHSPALVGKLWSKVRGQRSAFLGHISVPSLTLALFKQPPAS